MIMAFRNKRHFATKGRAAKKIRRRPLSSRGMKGLGHLVLPHPRSFAQFFPEFPDLTVELIDGVAHSCAGPLLLRVSLSFKVKNIGTVVARFRSPHGSKYAIQVVAAQSRS
jgi:hypothetical protein